jgi:drug/metabolite transporter (DMT)-like permease
MRRRSWILLGLLSALWGASYLFIKLGLEDLSPAMVVFGRTALAALVLLPVALARNALRGLRGRLTAVGLLAAVQIAGPFMLISVGEQEISSSLAGILVATAPIFTALLAIWVDHEERSHGLGLVGIAVGIVGVALLLGVDAGGSRAALVGGLLVVLASLGYAIGGFYLKRRLSDHDPVGVVTAAMVSSALLALPAAVASAPASLPAAGPVAAVAALGIAGTGLAFVIFYTLIAVEGPAKASLVAYVAPGFAVAYGVALLGEDFTAATLAGLVLIVAGSWLAAEGRLPRAASVEEGGVEWARRGTSRREAIARERA